MQSKSEAQLVRQLVAPQTYAPHGVVVPWGHLPVPMQNEALV